MAVVSLVNKEQYDEVISLYQRVGYGGGLASDDLIVGARIADSLVGVVRLATENELLVLRGMHVRKEFQRQGIGLSLLRTVQDCLGDRECWCLPYSHLRDFYMLAGFSERPPEAAPGFLVARMNSYIELGRQVILMERAARS